MVKHLFFIIFATLTISSLAQASVGCWGFSKKVNTMVDRYICLNSPDKLLLSRCEKIKSSYRGEICILKDSEILETKEIVVDDIDCNDLLSELSEFRKYFQNSPVPPPLVDYCKNVGLNL